MENKWLYLWMNICYLLSISFYYSGIQVCNLLQSNFQNGVVIGASLMMSKMLAILAIVITGWIIKNNINNKKSEQNKEESTQGGSD